MYEKEKKMKKDKWSILFYYFVLWYLKQKEYGSVERLLNIIK